MNHERPQRIALGAFVNYRTNSSPFEKGELGAVLTEGINPAAQTHSPRRPGWISENHTSGRRAAPPLQDRLQFSAPARGVRGAGQAVFLSAWNGWKYVPEKRRMGAIVNINSVDTGIIQGVIQDLSTLSTGFSTGKRKKVPVGTAFFKKL